MSGLVRHRNKVYVRIPGGEVQYGRLSRSVVVWFRGRSYRLAAAVPSREEEK